MGRLGTIYALRDPETFEVRYVGQTVHSMVGRLNGHLAAARGRSKTLVAAWIRTLPCEPVITAFEEGLDVGDLSVREKFWIAEMKSQGCALLNMTPGGGGNGGVGGCPKGHKWTDEQREAHRKRMAKVNRRPEKRVASGHGRSKPGPMSADGKARHAEARARQKIEMTPERRAKISATRKGKSNHKDGCTCSFCTDPGRGARIRWAREKVAGATCPN